MSLTFVNYFQKWFETYREPKIRRVSARKYEILIKQLDKTSLGHAELTKIKRKDVQEFFNDFGNARRRKTVLDIHRLIKASFVDANLDGLIKHNPCDRIELVTMEDNWTISKLKEVREAKKWLDIDEYKRTKMYLIGILGLSFQQSDKANIKLKNEQNEAMYILKSKMYPPQMSLMVIYVALKTGARFSEILGITKEDINSSTTTLNIDKTWDYKFGQGFVPTKNTSSIRQIIVDNEFLAVIEAYYNWLDKYNIKLNNGAIFVKNQTRVYNSSINNILKMIFEALKIESISLHKLRHTHASILIAEGISLQVVAKRLGHADTSMVQEVYGHLLKSVEEKENMRVLEVI